MSESKRAARNSIHFSVTSRWCKCVDYSSENMEEEEEACNRQSHSLPLIHVLPQSVHLVTSSNSPSRLELDPSLVVADCYRSDKQWTGATLQIWVLISTLRRGARPLEASIHIPDSADGFQPTSENVIIRWATRDSDAFSAGLNHFKVIK